MYSCTARWTIDSISRPDDFPKSSIALLVLVLRCERCIDFQRNLILCLLRQIAEVFQRQALVELSLEGIRADPQCQQLLRIVEFVAEFSDIKFIEPRNADLKVILAGDINCFKHLPDRIFY